MPDTGAPWNIPYVDPTDLVRDYPQASEDLADAIADGLSAAGGLVAVKHALFTGVQTNSTAGSANFAVDDLSITHTLADASNKLIISAYIGAAGTSQGPGNVGIAVADTGTLIGIGNAASSRTRVGAGGIVDFAGGNQVVTMPSVTFVYEPGDTASHTYTVRAINIDGSTRTLYINRNEADADGAGSPRASSGFVIQEVKV
jgi:L-serine deaminase